MENEINSKNIPLEYRIPLQGRMNKGVFECINGGFGGNCPDTRTHRHSKYNVVEDIIGFAETQWGWMVVWKCKDCGQVQFFHLRENEQRGTFDYVRMYHEWKTTGKYEY